MPSLISVKCPAKVATFCHLLNTNSHTMAKKTTTAPKSPDYIVYQVTNRKNGKSVWNRVGAAWSHLDGKGINIVLKSLPVDGQITLRKAESSGEEE